MYCSVTKEIRHQHYLLAVPVYLRKLPPSFVIRFLREDIGRGKVVYIISCIVSGEQYVGETGAFHTRMRKHSNDLAGRRHHSKLMQRALNSYGPDAFRVEIVENCDRLPEDSRKKKEEFYIWAMQPAFNS
jgi:predicted GIY-YIG superfamily endonuclease